MAAILNFRIFAKMEKHKFAAISLTMRNRAISSKFRPRGYLIKLLFAIFKKILLSPKMVAILNFQIFAKNAKTQLLNHVRAI